MKKIIILAILTIFVTSLVQAQSSARFVSATPVEMRVFDSLYEKVETSKEVAHSSTVNIEAGKISIFLFDKDGSIIYEAILEITQKPTKGEDKEGFPFLWTYAKAVGTKEMYHVMIRFFADNKNNLYITELASYTQMYIKGAYMLDLDEQ